jgi:hypothetical protein
MRLSPHLAVFFQREIPMPLQLGKQLRLQSVSFSRPTAWNGLGSQLTLLSLLFEVSFDGRPRHAKQLDDFVS